MRKLRRKVEKEAADGRRNIKERRKISQHTHLLLCEILVMDVKVSLCCQPPHRILRGALLVASECLASCRRQWFLEYTHYQHKKKRQYKIVPKKGKKFSWQSNQPTECTD